MDIISHTLTGVAVGTVFATMSDSGWKKKGLIVLSGAFGGALPDIDAISLWSKFDTTIGSLLNLKHTGKEIYFGKFWYSHHAALHSIVAPLFLILISILSRSIFRKDFKYLSILNRLKHKKLSLFAFFFGFIFHLLEDMPTPASVWGGVKLFFPNSNYIGGFGKIWWWNNYDLVLIIFGVITINLLINLLPVIARQVKVKLSIGVFTLGFCFALWQINTRPVDFSYSGHTADYNKFEAQSKQVQKEILGDKLFFIMTKIDDKIPLHF